MDPETRFRAVFDAAYGPLCRYARHRGLTGPDAEDLVAQTLEVAWRRIGDVPVAEPLPWLYAVAHNLWRNRTRRDRRRRELLARFRASADGEAVPGGNNVAASPRGATAEDPRTPERRGTITRAARRSDVLIALRKNVRLVLS